MSASCRISISPTELTALVVAVGACAWAAPGSAGAKEKLDARVAGHYVHLVANEEKEDPPYGMKPLMQSHRTCMENAQAARRPYLTEPSGGWPKTRSRVEIDVYYSRTRTAVIERMYRYYVKLSNCDLEERLHQKITLRSGAGGCVANFDRKVSYGQCNSDVHRQMLSGPPNSKIGHNYKKVGEREVSGHKCTVYTVMPGAEVCVANPKSEFPIPDAFQNGLLPGLKLQINNRSHDIKADVVRLHTEFKENVFSIPEGLRHLSIPWYENRYKGSGEADE